MCGAVSGGVLAIGLLYGHDQAEEAMPEEEEMESNLTILFDSTVAKRGYVSISPGISRKLVVGLCAALCRC